MSGKRSNAIGGVKATEATATSEENYDSECQMLDEHEIIDSVGTVIPESEHETVVVTDNTEAAAGECKLMPVSGNIRLRPRKHGNVKGDIAEDVVINDNILETEKSNDEPEGSCFKIDKVYSVAGEDDLESYEESNIQAREDNITNERDCEDSNEKSTGKDADTKDESKETKEESKSKDEKPIKPRTARATLAKVPSLAGGVGSVRMLGGGVRATSMPLIVSMGAGNPGIPLLPAGLPPGRYVILPGSSTTTTKSSTVTTMSSSMTPRLATSVATSAGQTLVAAQKSLVASPIAPPSTPQPAGDKIYTRERGRRKSYTAGEKLAMIKAVEGGQRKSAVADRFGVAPSTLASILAQKHKIRSEQQDNLTRRRVRHAKYQLREDTRSRTSTSASSMRLSPSTDHPFTHFLAPLSAPTPTVLDTQPEDIIAVPDLMERLGGGGSGASLEAPEADGCKQEGHGGDVEDESQSEELTFLEPESVLESELVQDQHVSKGGKLSQDSNETSQPDVDDPLSQDAHIRTSPTAGGSGLVGPYLLKKETHCSTVLDQLMRDETFTDVTLTAEGQSLRAHRIVLCLASPYFRQVLSHELPIQSVVILRDIKFAELRNIIHFIYTGEATVDASELESFMRTAELLEITSLCEGHKCTTSRGSISQNTYSSGFSISDFERLVGTKRIKKEASPTPSKVRRLSGEGHSSRSSSTEPTATINPLSLIKEEPDCDNSSLFNDKSIRGTLEGTDNMTEETQMCERTRRDSGESVGGFAAIAGVQKNSDTDDRTGDFSSLADPSPVPQEDESASQSLVTHLSDTAAVPGRCPYCPHITQKFEGVAMMRHLLVTHPCKPAFPCDSCWRVFVKRTFFKSHQQKCQKSLC